MPKHLKERIERKVAYEVISRDISRWLPMVAANRKAEQLDFTQDNSGSMRPTNASLVDKFKVFTIIECFLLLC